MNTSEKQLKETLKHLNKNCRIRLSLKPQGMRTTISPEAVNLCTLYVEHREYFFGGISESFYDKMVFIYDSVDRGK